MKVSHLRIAGASLLIVGLLLLWTGTRKSLTLILNGESKSFTTHALRVIDLLTQLGFERHPVDRISLDLKTWLVNKDVLQLEQAAVVVIYVDGNLSQLTSPIRVPANLLGLAQVRLYPGDRVLVNGLNADPAIALDYSEIYRIQVLRAVQARFHDQSSSQIFYTSAPTVAQALAEQGQAIYATDWINGGFDAPPKNDLETEYQSAQKLEVHAKAGLIEFYSAAASIGAALAERGIALQSLDYTQPATEEPLPEDGVIRLMRVSEQVVIEQEPIAYESELQPAPDVELDQRITLQAGEYGLLARRVRIRTEDGEEVSRRAEAEWVAQPVKNRIVGYGTKVVVKTLSTPDGPIEYWRSVSMYATSYSPCRIFDDRCDSYTASGAELKKGIVAVRGYWYRYYGGTQVYVPGYGVGLVADVGGGIPGRFWIDLGYSDSDYISWHQDVTVYFLTPVPDQIMYIVQ
jgi:uncharacterized protein YabE (DUF348 family)